jgi:hypothetical protein
MPHLRVHARAASRSARERSIEKSSAMVSTCRADLIARDRAHGAQVIDSEITPTRRIRAENGTLSRWYRRSVNGEPQEQVVRDAAATVARRAADGAPKHP